MASFKAVLQVAGNQYEIRYSEFNLWQFTDELGRPASPTLGGGFVLDIEEPPKGDSLLFEWAISPVMQLNGQVVFWDLEGKMLKVIKFHHAFLVNLRGAFDGSGQGSGGPSKQTQLTISPQAVDNNGQLHDNNWPAPDPIVDWDWSAMNQQCNPEAIKPKPEPSALSEGLHTLLDVVGMIPVVGELADGANAAIYAAQGDYANAALSAAAMIPIAGNVVAGAKFFNKGSKALKAVLKNADTLSKADILQHVQKNMPSLKLKGKSPDGRFHEFVDSRGTTRLKIHPPDKVTPYDHIHIYNRAGQPLDAGLKIGDTKSIDVHIKIKQ